MRSRSQIRIAPFSPPSIAHEPRPPAQAQAQARAALDQGCEPVFAEDAMSSMSAEAHSFSIPNIFPIMGRVRSTEEIIAALHG